MAEDAPDSPKKYRRRARVATTSLPPATPPETDVAEPAAATAVAQTELPVAEALPPEDSADTAPQTPAGAQTVMVEKPKKRRRRGAKKDDEPSAPPAEPLTDEDYAALGKLTASAVASGAPQAEFFQEALVGARSLVRILEAIGVE